MSSKYRISVTNLHRLSGKDISELEKPVLVTTAGVAFVALAEITPEILAQVKVLMAREQQKKV